MQKQEKIRKNSKKLTNLLSEKNLMHKNAIKIVWGDQKIKIMLKKCALLAKIVALFEIFSMCAFLCYFWPNTVRLGVQKF